ncbi:energy transducer TonB [Luteimonas sp. Sa2BVA3]|uniref:Energy transducer TonB n=1 Tax=Luteimonas colneyensis TaxID=2762230 RepID=A0ABR8UFQ5_9GAMM|nr:energy transducer TonB [Luteimonas colneyensis]MBD7986494.1 energy transducer TonB [Luteimonas colneyensis]
MSDTPPRRSLPLPTHRGWWLVAAGLAAGLLVFLALWLGQRDGTPYRPDEQPPAAAAPVFRPLPAPPASGTAATPGMPEAPAGEAWIEETAPQPAVASAADADADADAPPAIAPVELSASSPVPIESPSPRYPRSALRRGESGEVLLRIEVDPRGVPSQVDVAASSGSRDLDRAAVSAARRWRFRPAMRDGVPVSGVVNVPIAFSSPR